MRHHPVGRRDANHAEIAQALEDAGRSVLDLSGVGGGCPDILVGWGGTHSVLMEIKTEEGKMRGSQTEFFRRWKGPKAMVRDKIEALRLTGVTV